MLVEHRAQIRLRPIVVQTVVLALDLQIAQIAMQVECFVQWLGFAPAVLAGLMQTVGR